MDGPRTDINGRHHYTYYANNDSDLGKRGTSHDRECSRARDFDHRLQRHGQPLTIRRSKRAHHHVTYDERQRLNVAQRRGEITSYDYDGVGQLGR